MRCEASELEVGSCASPASPDACDAPEADASQARAAPSAIAVIAAIALPQRSTSGFVEEVQLARVDGDRDLVAEPNLDVRRVRRHEVGS